MANTSNVTASHQTPDVNTRPPPTIAPPVVSNNIQIVTQQHAAHNVTEPIETQNLLTNIDLTNTGNVNTQPPPTIAPPVVSNNSQIVTQQHTSHNVTEPIETQRLLTNIDLTNTENVNTQPPPTIAPPVVSNNSQQMQRTYMYIASHNMSNATYGHGWNDASQCLPDLNHSLGPYNQTTRNYGNAESFTQYTSSPNTTMQYFNGNGPSYTPRSTSTGNPLEDPNNIMWSIESRCLIQQTVQVLLFMLPARYSHGRR